MSSNDLLLGFDAREMWLDFSEDWPEERKRSFLPFKTARSTLAACCL
jgi:hypothetical protein